MPTSSLTRVRQRIARRSIADWAIAASFGIAGINLFVEARTEPFHIDEIRQVGYYSEPLAGLIDKSYGQEQPPLDAMIGAVAQVTLGSSDFMLRLPSIGWGLVTIAGIVYLLYRVGFHTAAATAAFVMAISPGFINYTAYARPYALPIALMMGFAVGTDLWLKGRSIGGAVVATLCAGALPLSRVFEPPAFLGLSIVTLAWYARRNPSWRSRSWVPIGAAAMSLLVPEALVYRRLSAAFDKYADAPDRSWGTEWSRIIDDSIPRLLNNYRWPLAAVVIVILAFGVPGVRHRLQRLWWFWPLAGSAVAFAVAFHIQAAPPQPFFTRYGYFWIPPLAILAGVLLDAAVERWRSGARPPWTIVAAASVVILALGAVISLASDFAAEERINYSRIAEETAAQLEPRTPLLFEDFRGEIGQYRTGFYGKDRYLGVDWTVVEPEHIIAMPGLVEGGGSFGVLLVQPPSSIGDLPGWTRRPIDDDAVLYLPEADQSFEPVDAAQVLVAVADEAGTRTAMLRLSAASLYASIGDDESACAQYRLSLEESPRRTDDIVALANEQLPDMVAECTGT